MSIQVRATWHGDQAKQAVQSGAARGLLLAANHVLTEANRTVPWDQGPLERSGAVDVDGQALQASVYYDTPYARRQHEELGWHHPKKGRAKWLELTLREQSRTVSQIMANALQLGRDA